MVVRGVQRNFMTVDVVVGSGVEVREVVSVREVTLQRYALRSNAIT